MHLKRWCFYLDFFYLDYWLSEIGWKRKTNFKNTNTSAVLSWTVSVLAIIHTHFPNVHPSIINSLSDIHVLRHPDVKQYLKELTAHHRAPIYIHTLKGDILKRTTYRAKDQWRSQKVLKEHNWPMQYASNIIRHPSDCRDYFPNI